MIKKNDKELKRIALEVYKKLLDNGLITKEEYSSLIKLETRNKN